MPGFISNSACTDTWSITQYRTMYDFGIAMAQRRWVALGHGWAGAASFTDGAVGRYYDFLFVNFNLFGFISQFIDSFPDLVNPASYIYIGFHYYHPFSLFI